ncbi:MAG: ATP synthase F1 subunit gamma [Chloroflexi bacterium]|nr:ATP synthase F1 subunit gamma [Chloroflexota bacterium]MBI3762283.1 ATP synthase F1 subunit gamma [Chloroflexota bacterium]
MPSAREMRLRIRSVKNIAQVTRALEAVSASKVKKAQQATFATRAYAAKAWEVLTHLAAEPLDGKILHPLLEVRPEVRAITIVFVSGDRGLAGAYNTNMVRAALNFERAQTAPIRWITVGRKGRDMLLRRRKNIIADFSQRLSAAPLIREVRPIARAAIDDFLRGDADEVVLAYSDFVNTLTQKPTIKRLLPILPGQLAGEPIADHIALPHVTKYVYIYEPSPEAILDVVLPRFTELQIYQAILESLASEHSARMVAMRNATDNANELVENLRLTYNKARQQSITSDLLDIAGGAEALAQTLAK